MYYKPNMSVSATFEVNEGDVTLRVYMETSVYDFMKCLSIHYFLVLGVVKRLFSGVGMIPS